VPILSLISRNFLVRRVIACFLVFLHRQCWGVAQEETLPFRRHKNPADGVFDSVFALEQEVLDSPQELRAAKINAVEGK
jgi:hypothetical protein